MKGGRKFKLERRLNGVGRFIFCFVIMIKAKRFTLIFPKGRGFHGGWSILTEKLYLLGVVPTSEARRVVFPIEKRNNTRMVSEMSPSQCS